MEALDSVMFRKVKPALYATEVKCQLNVRRYIFVVVDASLNLGDVVEFSALRAHYKSIQFKEFKQVDATSPVFTSKEFIAYHDLVQKLAHLRNVHIRRTAVSLMGTTKVSEYVSDDGTMVLLFHTTDHDQEFVDQGNLLSALVTFNTLVYPEYTPLNPLPVYEVNKST